MRVGNYARIRFAYDFKGGLVKKSFFDANGVATGNSNGYAVAKYKNDRKHQFRLLFLMPRRTNLAQEWIYTGQARLQPRRPADSRNLPRQA